MENEVLTSSVIVGGAIIGFINAIQIQFPQTKGLISIGIAAALGIVAGAFSLFGLNIETGLITGLSSVGVYKVATKAGGN